MAYFSNGTEGTILDLQCSECPYGEDPCPIALMQMLFNYDQVGNELASKIMDTLIDAEGFCQMKKLIDKKSGLGPGLATPEQLGDFLNVVKFEGIDEQSVIDKVIDFYLTIKRKPITL